MPPKKGSASKDSMSASDLTATFLAVLDNDEVITKLVSILAASINLILDETLFLQLPSWIALLLKTGSYINVSLKLNWKTQSSSKLMLAYMLF
jgi:hypothetical protein